MASPAGEETGWPLSDEQRLSAVEATFWARTLEQTRQVWASQLALGQGGALVELRSRVRPFPLLKQLRTVAECQEELRRLRTLPLPPFRRSPPLPRLPDASHFVLAPRTRTTAHKGQGRAVAERERGNP